MFLCYRGKRLKPHTSALALMFLSHADVSPWLLAAQRPYVLMSLCSFVFRVSGCQVTLRLMFLCSRGKRQARTLYLMFLCPYVLLSPALAAAHKPIGTHVFSLKKAVNTDFTGIIRLDYQHIYIH